MALAFSNRSLRSPLPSFLRKPESSSFEFRRTSIYVGAIVFLSLLSCSLPKPNPFLEGPKLRSFEQAGPLTVYNRNNLFDYMNGEAEAYFPFGFHLLYVSIFSTEKTDSRMVLEIYDMNTPQGAGGILKKYSGEGGSSLPGTGDAAWSDKGIVLLRQGNYFMRIFPDPSPENEVKPTMQEMIDLARQIVLLF
ncbi:MAG: hypothetical protein NTY44_10910 [Deltaproteobacteria bacterium]|nr:hypothetical protein [Deltaproteobacteria bacterium]